MQEDFQNNRNCLTKAEWQKLSGEWEAGELSQSDFCKLKGLKLSTFVYWRQKLMQKKIKAQTNFIPAKINMSSVKELSGEGVILKLPNGISLQISSNTDKVFLRNVFELLGITTC